MVPKKELKTTSYLDDLLPPVPQTLADIFLPCKLSRSVSTHSGHLSRLLLELDENEVNDKE